MSDVSQDDGMAVAALIEADRLKKGPNAYRTISEVADELQVPQHVLRFWETRFPEVRPLKRGGGRRYYRPEDVDVLRQILHLLFKQGYTIKGAQEQLRRSAGKTDAIVAENAQTHNESGESMDALETEQIDPEDIVPALRRMSDEPQAQRLADVIAECEALRAENSALKATLREVLEELDAIRGHLPD